MTPVLPGRDSQPSTTRSRLTRRVALAAVVAGGAASLVACQKPLPDVTFQSGSRSVLVAPSTYCFTLERDSCRGDNGVTTLLAAPGDTINISVPRSIALNAWIVAAKEADDSGQLQPLDGAGSDVIRDNHHTRVQVPNLGAAPYLLTVTEFRGTTPTGSWTIQVNIKG